MDKNLNSQYAYNDEEEDYYDEKINETAPSVRSRNDKPNTALGTQNMSTALIQDQSQLHDENSMSNFESRPNSMLMH